MNRYCLLSLSLFALFTANFSFALAADEPAGVPAEVAQYVSAPAETLNLWPDLPPGGVPEGIGEEKWEPGDETPPIVRM